MPTLQPVAAEAVLEHLPPGANVIVPLANGEPSTVLDAIEAAADRLERVRVHQMHALRERPYLDGRYGDHLRHVSYFLSPATREVVAQTSFERRRRASANDVPNIVSAFDEALGGVMKEIVVWTVTNPALSVKRG